MTYPQSAEKQQDANLPNYPGEFIDWLSVPRSDFEEGRIQSISIAMPTSIKSNDCQPYSFPIHGIVQVIVQKDKSTITSQIHITDESNLEKLMIVQTPYDMEQNKICCEVKGVFLSHSDVLKVLTYLLNHSINTFAN